MVEKTIFGTMEDGREVSRYTLTNQNGVSASFLDLGAIWSTMLVPDRNGEMADVLLGHENSSRLPGKRWASGRGCWTKCKPDWRRGVYVK